MEAAAQQYTQCYDETTVLIVRVIDAWCAILLAREIWVAVKMARRW